MDVEKQVLIIWTVSNGLADDIEVDDLKRFEEELIDFIENSHPAVLNTLRDKKSIDDDLKASMREAVEDFKGDALERKRTGSRGGITLDLQQIGKWAVNSGKLKLITYHIIKESSFEICQSNSNLYGLEKEMEELPSSFQYEVLGENERATGNLCKIN